MRKSLFNGLGVLQAFIGVGAVAGGLGLSLDPSGESHGIPLELLEETPFATFLIPGIVLLLSTAWAVSRELSRPSRDIGALARWP